MVAVFQTPGAWVLAGGGGYWSAECRAALAACGIDPDNFGTYQQRLDAQKAAREGYQRPRIAEAEATPRRAPGRDHVSGCVRSDSSRRTSRHVCSCHEDASAFNDVLMGTNGAPPNPSGSMQPWLTANAQSGHISGNAFYQDSGARGDPSCAPDEAFDHYSIPAFDSGRYPAKELGSSIKSQKFLVSGEDLLVSKLNPSTSRVWIPFSASSRRAISSTEFLVCRALNDVGRAFAYCLACSESIVEAMTGLAGGTSNSHQRIRPGDFLALACCTGSEKARSAFAVVAEPLVTKSLALRTESKSLSSTRDTLLPKLISGEIRIPDAEKMLKEVGI